MPSSTKFYEWLEKKCNLASFMILESWRKASALLGLSDMNKAGASCFVRLEGPPCIAFGVVLSIDVLPCGSGKGSHLFGLGDCSGIRVGGQPWVGALPWGVLWWAE